LISAADEYIKAGKQILFGILPKVSAMPAQQKLKNNLRDGESDHETIDINVSDTSTSDGEAPPSPPKNLPEPPTLAPLLPSAPTTRANRAHDIDYFFNRGSRTDGSLTICKQCR